MAAGIDCHRANIHCDYSLAHGRPIIPVVSRTKNAAQAVYKIGSCKDVTVGTDCKGPNKVCEEAVVDLFPTLTAIARSEHADPICAGKDSVVSLDREGPDVGRNKAVVFLNPQIAVVAGPEDAAANVGSCKDVPARIDGEGNDPAFVNPLLT